VFIDKPPIGMAGWLCFGYVVWHNGGVVDSQGALARRYCQY